MKAIVRNIILILGAALILSLVAGIFYAILQPKPHQWKPGFDRISKAPYGTKIFFQQLYYLFPGSKIKALDENALKPYVQIVETGNTTVEQGSDEVEKVESTRQKDQLVPPFNLLVVDNFVTIQSYEAQLVLRHIQNGNQGYFSFLNCNEELQEELGCRIHSNYNFNSVTRDDVGVAYRGYDDTIRITKPVIESYFDSIPEDAEVMAWNDQGKIISVRMFYGTGSIVVNLYPYLFSNYYLLNQNVAIVEQQMQLLPNRDTRYFTYLSGITREVPKSPSLLTFVNGNESLSWAFYLLVSGLLFYLVLQLRRIERPVPVITPPENLSLNYIRTLSDLFYYKGDYKAIVKRKMDYFLHVFNKSHRLPINQINNDLADRIAVISGQEQKDVRRMFIVYHAIMAQTEPDRFMFKEFNTLMQLFKK